MDQVTQVALGAAAAQAVGTHALGRKAWIVGGVAALLPDLDMAFVPLADPLFPIELHRTFTHGLVMVPVLAALTTLLLWPFRPFRTRTLAVFLIAMVGALTHAPLDVLTSYGTMALWPFRRAWLGWDVVSIIDPVYTLILVVGVVLAAKRISPRPAWIALALSCLYLGLGVVQRDRAREAQAALAQARGHQIEHGRVIPSLGGPLVWRSLYVAGGRIHADAIKLAPFAPPTVQEAGSATVFTAADVPATIPDRAHVVEVFERYRTFADGFIARTPGDEEVVGDMRYTLAYGFDPVWGMKLVEGHEAAWTERVTDRMEGILRLAGMAFGTRGAFHPLPAAPAMPAVPDAPDAPDAPRASSP